MTQGGDQWLHVPADDQEHAVLTLAVPTGSYAISATLTSFSSGGPGEGLACGIRVDDEFVAKHLIANGSVTIQAVAEVLGGGTIDLACVNRGGGATVFDRSLLANQVAALN